MPVVDEFELADARSELIELQSLFGWCEHIWISGSGVPAPPDGLRIRDVNIQEGKYTQAPLNMNLSSHTFGS